MTIKDPKGMYTIKLDTARNICYETPVGLWTKEDYQRYNSDYMTKIGSALNGKSWSKCIDLKNYKTSNITDEIAKHAEWMEKTKCTTVAVIVENAIIKMQMNRAAGGKFAQQAFTEDKEADEWLKSKGF